MFGGAASLPIPSLPFHPTNLMFASERRMATRGCSRYECRKRTKADEKSPASFRRRLPVREGGGGARGAGLNDAMHPAAATSPATSTSRPTSGEPGRGLDSATGGGSASATLSRCDTAPSPLPESTIVSDARRTVDASSAHRTNASASAAARIVCSSISCCRAALRCASEALRVSTSSRSAAVERIRLRCVAR